MRQPSTAEQYGTLQDIDMTEKNGHHPQSVATDQAQWQHYDHARQSLQAGQADQALASVNEALSIDPNFSPALELAGVLACQQQDFETGISHFKTLTSAEPESAPAWFNLGNALASSGDEAAAIEPLRKAVELKPDYYKPAVILAQALYATGEHSEAIDQLEHVIHHDPDNVMALNTLSTLLARLENFEAAIPHIQHAASLQPRVTELQANLGMIQLRAGNIMPAQEAFLTALSINHRDIESRFGLGAIARLKTHHGEAADHFRKVIKWAPNHLSAMHNLIECLRESGSAQEADQYLTQARQQWPDDDRLARL